MCIRFSSLKIACPNRKILIILICLTVSFLSFSQTNEDIKLLFNNKSPEKSQDGYHYSLEDIINSDSIQTNIQGLKIIKFICSSICSIDWEYHCNSNKLGKDLKQKIEGCSFSGINKLYFNNIYVKDSLTNKIRVIDEIIILVKK